MASGPRASDTTADRLLAVCRDAKQELHACGAGLSVLATDGELGLTIASDPETERVEELHFTLGEGPCIDAQAAHRPVMVPDIGESSLGSRWPAYVPAALAAGILAIFALPLQIGAARLGVLGLYRARPGALSHDDLLRALTYADRAVTILLDGQADATAQPNGLDVPLDQRAVVSQAQGMIMVQLRITLTEALVRMRAHAYAENRRITEVAADIVGRSLHFGPDQDRGQP